jgi:hypothetical protein
MARESTSFDEKGLAAGYLVELHVCFLVVMLGDEAKTHKDTPQLSCHGRLTG